MADSIGRKKDLFIGHDVFGRGTYGGGKYNSYIAAKICKENNANMAIFAPGWT